MPQVGNKHYPYTKEGMAAAAAARRMQAGGMATPMRDVGIGNPRPPLRGGPPLPPVRKKNPVKGGPRFPVPTNQKIPQMPPGPRRSPVVDLAVQKIMAENPGITREQALRIYHGALKIKPPRGGTGPRPHPIAPKRPVGPRRPVGMQEGGDAELVSRRANLERLGTTHMDLDGDGIISQAERYAAVGAAPSKGVEYYREQRRLREAAEAEEAAKAAEATQAAADAAEATQAAADAADADAQAADETIDYTIDPSLEPLQNLYGQVGAAGEEEARALVNAILSSDWGAMSNPQRELIGTGIYRRIANRLGMTDAAGNPIDPLANVEMTTGRQVQPSGGKALRYLSDMEGLEQGAGVEMLLKWLQGRRRTPTQEQLPPSGPFGTYDPSWRQGGQLPEAMRKRVVSCSCS
mgnify:CR=1 FL=1